MNASAFSSRINLLQQECDSELIAIANWWLNHTLDETHGGFYGEVGENNLPTPEANKGVILNARILWFFSALSQQMDSPAYRATADRAYRYLIDFFYDKEHGGFFWELNEKGHVVNHKKQIYAQAFSIYALCAYYQLTQEHKALHLAMECFDFIEQKAIDTQRGGYLEAFNRDWTPLTDWRLSDKDLNFPKTQNTHLHILEAYTSLHDCKPTPAVKAALHKIILLFDHYFIDHDSHHLRMFMDMDWQDYSPGITYGHDIEASWLILQALVSLNDDQLLLALIPPLLAMADTTLNEAVGEHDQVIELLEFATQKPNKDNVWWVQAEALAGFLHHYALTRDAKYFTAAEKVWAFIKAHHIDHVHGEWLWFSRLDDARSSPACKAGFWKCPYHNGRAMLEASQLLNQLKKINTNLDSTPTEIHAAKNPSTRLL